ncbi:MAG TPA: GNAT family N-acetyltransferase [Terriglobia bacterium]|nr:GNAT family N-acetyltransferase [Terriglobia bacterium]
MENGNFRLPLTHLTAPIIDPVKIKHDYKIELVQSPEDFFELREQWELLRKKRAQAVFFQSWIWNWVWWKHLAPAGSRLCIVTCRNSEGELIGLAPFYLYTYRFLVWPFIRQLRFIGTDPHVLTSEYLDILVDPASAEPEVLSQIARAVQYSLRWDSLWFSLHLTDSAVSRFLAPALSSFVTSRTSSLSFRVDTNREWKEYVSQRGKKTRKNIRYETNRILREQKAFFREIAGLKERKLALDTLVTFHETRWLHKGLLGAFAVRGFRPFLREMLDESEARGQLRIWAVFHGEKISAVLVAFLEEGNAYAFQMGFDSRYTKHSLGFVLLGLCIRACCEDRQILSLDLLSGGEAFKKLWTGEEQVHFTYVGSRKAWRVPLFHGFENAVAAGKRLLRCCLPVALIVWGKTRLLRWRRSR